MKTHLSPEAAAGARAGYLTRMFWFARLAHAIAVFDSGSSCSAGGNAIFSVPTPDAVDVPVDVAPAFVYSASGCGDLEATLSLFEAESEAPVTSATVDASGGLGALSPAEVLQENIGYTFGSSTFVDEVSIGFTTGTRTSTPSNIVPTVTALSASWLADPPELHLDATVDYSGAAGGDLIAQWIDGPRADVSGSTVTKTAAPGLEDQSSWTSRHELTEAPSEWCVKARTRELDGTWVEGDTVCAEVESAALCGCDAGARANGAGAAVGAAALLLGARRRR